MKMYVILHNTERLYLYNIHNAFISCVRLIHIKRLKVFAFIKLHKNVPLFAQLFNDISQRFFDGYKQAVIDDPRCIYNHSSSCGFSGNDALAYLAEISAAVSCCGVTSCSILIVCESLY